LQPPQFAIRHDSYVETVRRDGTLHEFNPACKSRRAAARGEGFMGFNVAMARRALIPHYDLGRYGRLFAGAMRSRQGVALISNIRHQLSEDRTACCFGLSK
jgi:hypothetical protein